MSIHRRNHWAIADELAFLETFVGPPSSPSAARGAATRVRNRKNALLELTSEQAKIEECLTIQRSERMKQIGVIPLKQMGEDTRLSYFEKKSARPFYYLQKAFSRTEDFFECSEEDEARLLPYIVVDPEKIPERLNAKFRLDATRDSDFIPDTAFVISKLKSLFPKVRPIQIKGHKQSCRIAWIDEVESSNHGTLLSFQNLTERKELELTGKSCPLRKVSIHWHSHIFSLARSQEHATNTLSEDTWILQKLREDTQGLLETWKDQWRKDQNVQVLEEIIQALSKKRTFHEVRALEDRLKKIQFTHAERDAARIFWALNDLTKALTEKTQKNRSVSSQAWVIRRSVRVELAAFGSLFQEIFATLQQWKIAESQSKEDVALLFASRISIAFNRYLRTVENAEIPWEPFVSFRRNLAKQVSRVRDAVEKQTRVLETTNELIAFLKTAWFHVRILHWEDELKRREKLTPNAIEALYERIRSLREQISAKHFFTQGMVPESFSKRTHSMEESLSLMHQALEKKDRDLLLRYMSQAIQSSQ